MPDNTGIEWTDASLNPVTGCTKVSPGCDNCYAETLAERFRGTKGHPYEQGFDLRLWPERLEQFKKWTRPRKIFVCSMSDLFQKDVPDEYIERVYDAMIASPHHTYQILTKRPQRMAKFTKYYFPDGEAPDFIWHGTSVENQDYEWRLDHLANTISAIRFVSAEPLLGPLDITGWIVNDPSSIDWVIVGGESGRGARMMNPDWARSIRDQCAEHGTAFFFKQLTHKDKNIPDDLLVRQFPA